MTTRWWRAFALFLLFVVLLGAAIAMVLATTDPHVLNQAAISIDGDRITFAEMGARPVVALLAGAAIAVVLVVVVPIVVCVPLLVAAFGLAVGLAAIAGTAALVFSPLLLLGWIVWRAARPARPAP